MPRVWSWVRQGERATTSADLEVDDKTKVSDAMSVGTAGRRRLPPFLLTAPVATPMVAQPSTVPEESVMRK